MGLGKLESYPVPFTPVKFKNFLLGQNQVSQHYLNLWLSCICVVRNQLHARSSFFPLPFQNHWLQIIWEMVCLKQAKCQLAAIQNNSDCIIVFKMQHNKTTVNFQRYEWMSCWNGTVNKAYWFCTASEIEKLLLLLIEMRVPFLLFPFQILPPQKK